MRLFHRNRTDDPEVVDSDYEAPDRQVATEPYGVERVDVVERSWSPGTVLTAIAGAALAVVGIIALTRTQVNETWYSPVDEVAGIDHTPLLAAIEIGVGGLLVLFGLFGARILSAFVCIATAVAAAVVAIDPGELQRELAIERWWAIAVAVTAAVLALVALIPAPARAERSYAADRVPRRYGRAIPQH